MKSARLVVDPWEGLRNPKGRTAVNAGRGEDRDEQRNPGCAEPDHARKERGSGHADRDARGRPRERRAQEARRHGGRRGALQRTTPASSSARCAWPWSRPSRIPRSSGPSRRRARTSPTRRSATSCASRCRIAEFGRNAIQTAKQVLIQRVREAERDRVFKEYSDKIGTLVRGVVQQVDRGNVIVKLDFTRGLAAGARADPALLSPPERLRARGRDQRGQVGQGPAGHPVAHAPGFPAPAVRERGARDRGRASSRSRRWRARPARARRSPCSRPTRAWTRWARASGLKGSRVQSIVRELGGERIDIVPWSAGRRRCSCRARCRRPRVMDVKVQEAEKRMLVIVADDQLSLAIGKGGQNARLAARLTGWKIDLSLEERREEAPRPRTREPRRGREARTWARRPPRS